MERRIFTTLCFVCGVLIYRLGTGYAVILSTALGIFWLWHRKLRKTLVLLMAVLALTVGYGRAWWDEAGEPDRLQAGTRLLQGVILEPPRGWGNSSVFFFQVLRIDGTHLPGGSKVLVRWSGCEQTLEVGDRWELSGRLAAPEAADFPGGFDQRQWLWSQHTGCVVTVNGWSHHRFIGPATGSTPHQLSYRARAWMMRKLSGISNERARALVAGVVFGETQSLPRDLQEQFRRTGTSHLLAASGMNVALLAGLILGGGRLLGYGPWRTAPLAIPAVVGYAFLAGCAPSITRAATGTSLALLALAWGRTSNAWNCLALSTWILLLWDPRQLYDLGFQLSIVAVIGLVGGPEPPKVGSWLSSSLVHTVSASLITLPFFWYSFGELSSTLLLSNLILGPVVELLFPLGLLGSVFSWSPVLWLNEMVARLSLFLVERLSRLGDPIALVPPTPSAWIAMSLAILCWMLGRRWSTRVLALPLLGGALLCSLSSGYSPQAAPGELVVRRVGRETPVYWLSTSTREVLVIEEEWQEARSRAMVRRLGCLIEPEVRVLRGKPLKFEWGLFRWEDVEPLLPGSGYLQLRVRGDRYWLET